MGNVVYGKNMTVNGESSVEQFRIEYLEGIPPWVASNTQGGVSLGRGNNDWRGFYLLFGHTPARFPNDSATFNAWPDNTTANCAVSGTARFLRLAIDWDQENGDYIRSRVDFASNGALSISQAAGSTDSSTPGHLSSKGLSVALDGGAVESNVSKMHLELDSLANMAAYVDSTTNGQTLRTQGDINGRGWYRINSDDPADWPSIGSVHQVDWYVTSTTYWAIQWMRCVAIREFGVDRKPTRTERPVGAVIYWDFCAHNGTSIGSIVNPASVTKWP